MESSRGRGQGSLWTVVPKEEEVMYLLSKTILRRLVASEMRFMRRKTRCTIIDKKRNKRIVEELQAEPITTCLQQYTAQWISHTECMADTRWSKLITSYKPPGKRSLGRPLKRWSETVRGR
jgi:hypothetical protein